MRAVLAEVIHVEVDNISVETIAQVIKGQVDHAADKRILPEFKEAAEQDAENHKNDHPYKRQEWASGQIPGRELFGELIQIHVPVRGEQVAFRAADLACEIAKLLLKIFRRPLIEVRYLLL